MIITKFQNTKINYILKYLLLFFIVTFSYFMPINPEIARKISIVSFVLLLFIWDYKKLFILIKNNIYIQLLISFIFLLTISYFWTQNHHELVRIFRTFLRYWIIPTLFLISIIEKEKIKYLIFSFLAGMITNLILSYSMYFFNLKELFNIKVSRFFLVPFQSSHMEYSIYLSLTILILIYYSIKNNNIYIKIIGILLSLLFLILLFIGTGRTGQVALIFSSSILTLLYFKNNLKVIVLAFLTLSLSLVLFFNISSNFKNRANNGLADIINTYKHNNYNSSLGVRLSAYIKIPELLNSSNFLMGVGYGDSQDEVSKINKELFGTGQNRQLGRLHQTFVTIYHAMGILGLCIFIFILYYLLIIKINNKDLNFIRYAFLFSIFISLMTMDFQNQREILLLFAFFSSLIIIGSNKKVENHTE